MSDGQQGQSLATIDKERRIGAALSVGMQIASAKFGHMGFNYWHFDANAGPGWNSLVNTAGSPLVFWQVATACLSGLRPAPFFCDIDTDALRRLQVRMRSAPTLAERSVLLPGDNQDALEVFAEVIRARERRPQFAVGSVLIDPNGYFYRNPKGIGAPIDALKWFTREFPRIDVVLNLNIRTYQMQAAHGHNVLPPREVLASLNKQHWLVAQANVSNGNGKGGNRFLLAVGRNVETGDHKKLQLYKHTSEHGEYILNMAEGKRQNDLPDLSGLSA